MPDDARAALQALLAIEDSSLDLVRFKRTYNLTAGVAEALWADLPMRVYGAPGAEMGIARARWDDLLEAVRAALADYHRAEPEREGASEAEITKRISMRKAPALLAALVDALITANGVIRESGLLRLQGHSARRDPRDEALWQRVQPLLDVADGRVPVVHDMVQPLKITQPLLESFLARAARQGRVVKASDKRYFLPETVARFAETVRQLAVGNAQGKFSVAQFRDRTAIGRNAAIEILEYFDRIGLTRRQGEVRIAMRPDLFTKWCPSCFPAGNPAWGAEVLKCHRFLTWHWVDERHSGAQCRNICAIALQASISLRPY